MQKVLTEQWLSNLKHDAGKIDVALSDELLKKLAAFTELLLHWNKTYNLTAITDLEDIRKLHILDSLTVVPFIKGPYILDVGSGAGFPGIPLALVLPQFKFVLLDSNNKKTNFLRQAVRHLSLTNVAVYSERAENFQHPTCFNTIITRATGSLLAIIAATRRLCCATGQWLFMKGKYPKDEICELENNQNNFAVTITTQCLKIPEEEMSRHLVCVTNQL
jgi:16S rRNA (guanine527-N7)-methyltransferase